MLCFCLICHVTKCVKLKFSFLFSKPGSCPFISNVASADVRSATGLGTATSLDIIRHHKICLKTGTDLC